ncbi:MAG TPA: HAD family hydrolase [Ilumatobacteraceae bacterium]|jgi:putative hydrolase of the HAD superfamily|nr:HAD family hydrolase [Ilumatobacteraceae bacterium]
MRFDVVGLDADDTLWHSEDSFVRVEEQFVELVAPFAPEGVDVAAALRATERAHLPVSGYGVKAFTLAMVKSAVAVTEGRVPALVVDRLVDAGLAMLTETVRLLPDVPAVLADLSRDHRLVLITKGDLVHQTRKVETSGIAHHFEQIEVVLEKDPATYDRILRQVGVAPDRFCMVGNSVRSDILPVLALGGHAVHIPYPLLWEHEHVDHDEDLDELASIKELPTALRTNV